MPAKLQCRIQRRDQRTQIKQSFNKNIAKIYSKKTERIKFCSEENAWGERWGSIYIVGSQMYKVKQEYGKNILHMIFYAYESIQKEGDLIKEKFRKWYNKMQRQQEEIQNDKKTTK